MFTLKKVSRSQAFFSHLIVSAIIFIFIGWAIYFHWYPGVLFWVDGGIEGMRLIAGVDFILGPLLTLIIFKPGKNGLFMDVILIAIVQISCLLIGLYIVNQNRTMALAYSHGTFFTIDKPQTKKSDGLLRKLDELDGEVPKYAFVHPEIVNGITNIKLNDPDLYAPFIDHIGQIIEEGLTYDDMVLRNEADFTIWFEEKAYDPKQVRFYESAAKYAAIRYHFLFDISTKSIRDYWPKRFEIGNVIF